MSGWTEATAAVVARIDGLTSQALEADDQQAASLALHAAVEAGLHGDAAAIFDVLGRFHLRTGDKQLALGNFENAALSARRALGEGADAPWQRWEQLDKLYAPTQLPAAGDGLTPTFSASPGDLPRQIVEWLLAAADLYLEMGQDGPAGARFEAAGHRAGSVAGRWPLLAARAHIGQSATARRAGELDAAEAHAEAALRLLDRSADTAPAIERAEALCARAEVARARGQLSRAEADLRAAAKWADGIEGVDALQALGEVLVAQDRGAEASAIFEAVAERLPADDGPRRARALWSAGRLALSAGALARADELLTEALVGAERAIGQWGTDEARVALAAAYGAIRDDAMRAVLALGETARALSIVDRGRGAAFRALLTRWQAAADAMEAPLPLDMPGNNTWQVADATRLDLYGADVEQAEPPPLDLPRLVFAVTDDDTARFVIAPGRAPRVDWLGIGRAALDGLVGACFEVDRAQGGLPRFLAPADASSTLAGGGPLSALAEAVLGDVELPGGPDTPLVVEPDGALWRIPFSALPYGSGHLGLQRPLVHAPSAAVVALCRALPAFDDRPAVDPFTDLAAALGLGPPTPPIERPRALIVGNPTMPPGSGLAPLPGAELEAAAVAARVGSAVLLTGDAATMPAVEAALAEVDILHLATHGTVADDPRRAWLALAPRGPDVPDRHDPETDLGPGRWSMGRVMKLASMPPLVVLSACATGQGTITDDGVIGFARAFLVAGARSVIVTASPVDDAVTARLMAHAYDALREMPLAHALRAAMRRLHGELSDEGRPWPALWAPFMLVGAET